MLKTVTNSINASQIQTPITLPGDVTLSTGNLIIGTSGKGIDFSATPGTGTSELLSDYEEGTWTPTLVASGGGASAADFTGRYTKIGNVVYFSVYMDDSASNNFGSGSLSIGNLPFSKASGANGQTVSNVITRQIAAPAGYTQLAGWMLGANSISLYWLGTGSNGFANLDASHIATASQVSFTVTGFYFV
jgi:hypothetical protein